MLFVEKYCLQLLSVGIVAAINATSSSSIDHNVGMTAIRKVSRDVSNILALAVRKMANDEADRPRPISTPRKIFSPRGRCSFRIKVIGMRENMISVDTCTALAATILPVMSSCGTHSTLPVKKMLGSQYMLNGRHCRN
jgi:hypothetical protein